MNLKLLKKFSLSKINEAIKRYKEVAFWITWDGLWRYRNAAIVTVVFSFLGLAGEVGTYTVIYKYASLLESDQTLMLFGYELTARTSSELLIVVAIAMFICSVMSALGFYFSKKYALNIWKAYEIFCARRITILSSYLPHPSSPLASEMFSKANVRMATKKEARYSGRVLFHILKMVLPVSRVFASVIVMFATNWFFSSIIFALLLAAQIFLYRLNVKVSKSSRSFEIYNKDSNQERNQLMAHIWTSPVPLNKKHPLLTVNDEESLVRKSMTEFLNRLLIKEKTSLVVNLLTAVSLLLILLVAGVGIISGQWRWSLFLIYVASLRFFLGSLMQASTSLTVISRYYPYIKGYCRFVKDAQAAVVAKNANLSATPVVLKVPSVTGRQNSLRLHSGNNVYLVHPGLADRDLLKMFHEKTETTTQFGIYGFAGNEVFRENSLRKCLGFPQSFSSKEVNEILEDMIVCDPILEAIFSAGYTANLLPDTGIRSAGIDLDAIISEQKIAELPAEIKYGLNMLAAILSGRPVIFTYNDGSGYWQDHFIQYFRIKYGDRLIVEIRDKVPEDLSENATVIFSNGEALTGWARGRSLVIDPELARENVELSSIPLHILYGDYGGSDD